jgi:hypothetical protein
MAHVIDLTKTSYIEGPFNKDLDAKINAIIFLYNSEISTMIIDRTKGREVIIFSADETIEVWFQTARPIIESSFRLKPNITSQV